ncbi:putative toxin-antitoxin system toxin component [Fructobacillus fructosus]|uniref:Toxin component of the YafQ-DinJ toxin-antitoxin module (YafQ) n=2 Tax=Fructobacillus fructosus TaxID=1631 RepID=A0ABN9Z0A5_9LACO|nr:putative toxin-antitoxin system toxin component [Fructobacillus fructosus]CAK1247945.1 mRNA-degrading endonuclease YafQ (mRNA interferase) [Fructobacillus fructosus]
MTKMNEYKYRVRSVNGFKKQYRKLMKGGRYRKEDFDRIVEILLRDLPIPASYEDHQLINQGLDRELHIKPDWVLIYRYDGEYVEFIKTGSHTNPF